MAICDALLGIMQIMHTIPLPCTLAIQNHPSLQYTLVCLQEGLVTFPHNRVLISFNKLRLLMFPQVIKHVRKYCFLKLIRTSHMTRALLCKHKCVTTLSPLPLSLPPPPPPPPPSLSLSDPSYEVATWKP